MPHAMVREDTNHGVEVQAEALIKSKDTNEQFIVEYINHDRVQ